MKEQFLNLTGLTELVGYLKTSIANHKEILPYASNKLFPSVGDINTIYIDTATNTIYRWDSSSKTYVTLAKAVKSVVISEATENGKITLTVDGNKTTVPIHGLGSAAYTNSSAYSPAGHTHTKAQVGLGNVDNTADANKSVKHATTADSATTAGTATNVSAGEGTADAARHVWFSDSATETKRAYSDKFKYNPVTNNLTVNVTGNAATASSVVWNNVTGKPSTYAPSAHNHNDSTITSLNASKLFGTIDIARLPHGALERCVIVEDDTARFALTTAKIQLGDTVKVNKTQTMYFVIDDSKLNSEAGYAVYTAGSATSVPWSGITGKPSTYPPSSHTHNYAGSSTAGGIAYNANALYVNPSARQASANYDLTNSAIYAYRVTYSIASSSMTTGKPPSDAHILTFGWDTTAGWGAQIAIGNSQSNHLYIRGAKSETKDNKNVSTWESSWRTVLDSGNYTSYTVTRTGSGASGTWGINISGNAAYPQGFQSRATSQTWGNQNGTFLTDWHTSAGGEIAFRENGSQLNVIIDGFFYQNEGKNLVLDSANYSNYAATKGHTHNYAGSGSVGGSANSAVKLDTATAGSATQPVYFSGGKPVACTYTLAKSVPADAKFTDTNTWRGVQNNLTSTATDQSLSAAQGKVLNEKKMGAVSANGYYGMAKPDGSASDWIRTTSSGIIPYQAGGRGSGHSTLGTSSWYFSSSYIDHMYSTDVKIADKVLLQYDSTNACLNFVFS